MGRKPKDASKAVWRHAVGKGDHRVSGFEHAQRKHVVYLTWPDPATKKPRHEATGITLRTKDGKILKERERLAKQLVQQKYEQLVAGKLAADDVAAAAAAAAGIPLTLAEGLARATAPKTGKYPNPTPYRHTLVKEVEFAIATWTAAVIPGTEQPWGAGRTWSTITRADWRMLGRARVDVLRAGGETGYRQAEYCLQVTIAVVNWLIEEELVEMAAPPKSKTWREELVKYWIESTGAVEAPKPNHPRYTVEEFRQILAKTGEVDPRLALLACLGAGQRGGQVNKCSRTHLTLPRALDPKTPRDVAHAELTIPARGKKRTPVLELTAGQLRAVERALKDGYLMKLEAAYQAGEIANYPLFPAAQMPGGRKALIDGSVVPMATVDRHATAKPVGMRTVSTWWEEAEALAEVKKIEGRGFYGGRRTSVDHAKEQKISREGLQAHGGWSDTQVPDLIYADEQNRVGRAESRAIRARFLGEEE